MSFKNCVPDHNQQLPVFGTPLEEHLHRTNREIASVIEICVSLLAEDALEEEVRSIQNIHLFHKKRVTIS